MDKEEGAQTFPKIQNYQKAFTISSRTLLSTSEKPKHTYNSCRRWRPCKKLKNPTLMMRKELSRITTLQRNCRCLWQVEGCLSSHKPQLLPTSGICHGSKLSHLKSLQHCSCIVETIRQAMEMLLHTFLRKRHLTTCSHQLQRHCCVTLAC